jgi:hypothetical protein
MSARFHLAQANIARMRAPLEDPLMEGFRSQLDAINALADASPGFVWRLQTDAGNSTAIRAYEDERILFNMSVWDSIAALHRYVYRSAHAGPLRERRRWFEKSEPPALVLWWVPRGQLPTIEDAKRRFELLSSRGPTRDAFTFRHPFPPPGRAPIVLPEVEAALCGSPEWAPPRPTVP